MTNSMLKYACFFTIVCTLFYPKKLLAQENFSHSCELEIGTDNDNFILYTTTDRYYTYGATIVLRWIPKSENFVSDIFSNKKNVHFTLGLNVKAFTPDYIDDTTQVEEDTSRPFAGWSYVDFKSTYSFEKSFLRIGVDVGILGPDANAGTVQNWVHQNITNDAQLDWSNQIPNQLGINFSASYYKSLFTFGVLDGYGEVKTSFGTVLNYVWPQMNFRLGKFHSITQSQARQNRILYTEEASEWFLEFGVGSKLSMYNATIQGNIFDSSSQFDDLGINNFIYRMHLGLYYSKNRFSGTIRYNYSTGEIEKSQTHRYGSLLIAYRFN